MKIPGPDHPITIERATGRWRARFAGHVIADSEHALILRESTYPARVYFPRDDVETDCMKRTDRSTHCPYKGDASYFTPLMDGNLAENGVWSYEEPFPAMAEIAGYLSFYPEKIEVYEVDAADLDARQRETPDRPYAPPHVPASASVDEVVQHTDSGAGHSQREHWPTNVSAPGRDDGGLV